MKKNRLKYLFFILFSLAAYGQSTNLSVKVVEVWMTNNFVALSFECDDCIGRTATVWKACTIEDGWYSQTDVVINASTEDISFRSNITCTNSGFLMISIKD
jgi:hypothetical protein